MRNYRDLEVWEFAHKLTVKLYGATDEFPRHELFGITSQVRRACASIPTNLAEACGRRSDKDFGRFVTIAMGSASEVDYLILLARDLGYLARDDYDGLSQDLNRVRRMLTGLHKSVGGAQSAIKSLGSNS